MCNRKILWMLKFFHRTFDANKEPLFWVWSKKCDNLALENNSGLQFQQKCSAVIQNHEYSDMILFVIIPPSSTTSKDFLFFNSAFYQNRLLIYSSLVTGLWKCAWGVSLWLFLSREKCIWKRNCKQGGFESADFIIKPSISLNRGV